MKKRNILMFIMLLIPVMFIKVEAKKFTAEEVVNEFNYICQDNCSNAIIDKISATIDRDNKKITINADDATVLLSYTDDYMEYNTNGKNPGENWFSDGLLQSFIRYYLLETMFYLSGVSDDYSAYFPDNYNNDFDKYNVSITIKEYTYTVHQDDGTDKEETAGYCDNYKIGFDSEKIAEYAKTYGKKTNTGNYVGLVPKFSLEISDGKPWYSLDLDYTPKDDDDTPYCKVYRSDTIDGNYVNIVGGTSDDWSINCIETMEGMLHGDTTAESNKVYYYKAQVIGSEKYSDIYKVDLVNNTVENVTKGEKVNTSDNTSSSDKDASDNKDESSNKADKKLENPNTGDFLPIIPIMVLLLAAIITWKKVENRFVKI